MRVSFDISRSDSCLVSNEGQTTVNDWEYLEGSLAIQRQSLSNWVVWGYLVEVEEAMKSYENS